jgi:hypothetical protein
MTRLSELLALALAYTIHLPLYAWAICRAFALALAYHASSPARKAAIDAEDERLDRIHNPEKYLGRD